MIRANLYKELRTADGRSALHVDITLKKGEITNIYGDSGVGKTMILRMLAGLTLPDKGFVEHEGRVWFSDAGKTNLAVDKRKVGFVFQDYGLFPNMTVEQNLRFAAVGNEESLIHYYMDAFGLASLKDRRPAQLSGGQKQRTAIARALIFKPELLLLDEPFTAQDKNKIDILSENIARYTNESKCITVLVTHDIAAALKLATYIYSIAEGRIVGKGSADEVFLAGTSGKQGGIHGTVAKISDSGGVRFLHILVGNDVLEIPEIHTGSASMPGDEVILSFDGKTDGLRVQKISANHDK